MNPIDIQEYFRDLKGFPQIDELMAMVSGGVPVLAPPSHADLESALRYGNHRRAEENLPLIWKKLGEDVRRVRCLVIKNGSTRDSELESVAFGSGRNPQGQGHQRSVVRFIQQREWERSQRGHGRRERAPQALCGSFAGFPYGTGQFESETSKVAPVE